METCRMAVFYMTETDMEKNICSIQIYDVLEIQTTQGSINMYINTASRNNDL